MQLQWRLIKARLTRPGCEYSSGAAAAPEQNPDRQFQIKTATVNKWELTLVDLLSSLSGCDTTVRKEVKHLELILHLLFERNDSHIIVSFSMYSQNHQFAMYICEVAIHRYCKVRLYYISNRTQRCTTSVQLPKYGGVSHSFLCCVGVRLRPLVCSFSTTLMVRFKPWVK